MNIVDAARNVYEALADAVFPLRERAARTKARSLEEIPLSPTSHDLLRQQVTTLMEYRDPAVQDLVRSLKYDRSAYAASLAAGLLADYLREELASAKTFSTKRIFLVPVPLHPSRARERGFNQIELVVRALPEAFRDGTLSTFAPTLLARTRATPPQTKLSRSERLSNVAGAFAANGQEDARKAHIFLIDDVTTTGATLVHAAAPLRRAGADVTLLALARA